MTALPKVSSNFDWGNMWADLLKGAGRGLLEYDGSRAAQAALAGLDVFDAAQEKRRQQSQQEPDDGTDQYSLLKMLSAMSPAEQVAYLQLPPEGRNAWRKEWAQVSGGGTPPVGQRAPTDVGAKPPIAAGSPPNAGRPISNSPFDRWHLQSVLPFGPDGSVNRPTYRR
jgi:hypothetical protein